MSNTKQIGEELKTLEKKWENKLPKEQGFIVRLDGVSFSKFTKGFQKPFDDILITVMQETTKQLLKRFDAWVGYTQSDEITLYFPPSSKINEKHTQLFKGRLQKLTSTITSYCSAVFNLELQKLLGDREDGKVAYFDARIYPCNGDIAIKSFAWRGRDCVKNAKSAYAHSVCSHKELHKLNGDEQVALANKKQEENLDTQFKDLPDYFKYGTIVKRNYIKRNEAIRTNYAYYYTPEVSSLNFWKFMIDSKYMLEIFEEV